MNTDILYLYGVGRSVETRYERREAFPREQMVRMGPWIIRPTRSVAVRKEDLAKHRSELVVKVTNGTVQLQYQDGTVIMLQDFDEVFGSTKTDFSSMSPGELLELIRGETPSVEMLRAYLMPIPVEERRAIAQGLRSIVDKLYVSDPAGLETLTMELNDAQQAFEEARANAEREQLNKEAAEADARARADAEAAAKVKAAEESLAQKKADEDAKNAPTPPPVVDEDDMNFSDKAPEEVAMDATKLPALIEKSEETVSTEPLVSTETLPVVTEPVVAPTTEVAPPPAQEEVSEVEITETPETSPDVVNTTPTEPAPPEEVLDESSSETPDEAAAADAKKVDGRELPEGWRNLSNTKLLELIGKIGAKVPEKKNKDQLTKTLETWLAGGS